MAYHRARDQTMCRLGASRRAIVSQIGRFIVGPKAKTLLGNIHLRTEPVRCAGAASVHTRRSHLSASSSRCGRRVHDRQGHYAIIWPFAGGFGRAPYQVSATRVGNLASFTPIAAPVFEHLRVSLLARRYASQTSPVARCFTLSRHAITIGTSGDLRWLPTQLATPALFSEPAFTVSIQRRSYVPC